MNSLISFMSTSLSGINMYSELFNNQDFFELIEFNSNKSFDELSTHFLKNLLFKYTDTFASEIIGQKNIESIFQKENLTDSQKIESYVKTTIKYYYNKYFKERVQLDNEMIEVILIHAMTIINKTNNNIQSGSDLYSIFITNLAETINDKNKSNIDKIFSEDNKQSLLNHFINLIKFINDINSYNPVFNNTDNQNSQDDNEFDDTEDTKDDKDDKDDKNEFKENKKRRNFKVDNISKKKMRNI